MLLGAFVTAIIQSSSATTVMVVGFVNSGIMKLANAIGIIMGANIGTTATGWILVLAGMEDGGGFSSATMFSLVAFIGIILYFFCKKPTQKNLGMVMLAFSVLMSGMQTMSGAMAPLKESAAFLNFISAVSNPLVAMAVGIVVTAIIQSCSASIGILQALSGAAILMIPFYVIHAMVQFDFLALTATSMGIAIVNTVFKVAATVLLAPFASLLQKMVTAIVPDKSDEDGEGSEENLLDERLLNFPPLALEQSEKAMGRMVSAAFKNLDAAIGLLDSFDQEVFDKVMRREDRVDRFEDRLGAYLVRLHTRQLSEHETQTSARILTCLSNVERISDHAVNLSELAQELAGKKIRFSPRALEELGICTDAIREIALLTRQAMEEETPASAHLVEPLEEVIDQLTRELKASHVQRVQSGRCTLELGFIFNDCINNFERVADHCSNIAVALLEANDAHLLPHDYLRALDAGNEEHFLAQKKHYIEKYCDPLRAAEE